jgi:hypothetical protein
VKKIVPQAPPALVGLDSRKRAFEAEREVLFPKWRAALQDADGNVTAAARVMFPELNGTVARNKGNKAVRRLGLADYAAELRKAKTGHARGRQDR